MESVGGSERLMRRPETIGRRLDVAVHNLRERAGRLYEALHSLRELTLLSFESTSRDPGRIDGWFREEGFGLDAEGYFERLDVLRRARAGESDPETQIYYADARCAEDEEARFRMYALRKLPRSVRGLIDRLGDLAWVYYQDATGFAMTHPMHDPSTVVPPDFDWHGYFTYVSVSPDVNPDGEIRWTPPNIDYGGKGLMVSVSIPLLDARELVGVWSFDLPVGSLVHESLHRLHTDESVFVVDRDGHLVAHDRIEAVVEREEGAVVREHIASLGGGFANLDVAELLDRGSGRLELEDADGRLLDVVHRSVERLDWSIFVSAPREGVVERIETSFLDAFERAGSGDLDHRMRGLDAELGPVEDAYNEMAAALQRSIRELESSRSQLRALFDASPVGILVLDEGRRIVEANDELARILGTSRSEIVGTNLVDLVSPEHKGELVGVLEQTGESSTVDSWELELRPVPTRAVPVRLVPRLFTGPAPGRILLGVEDLTLRRRLEDQLAHSQKIQVIGRLAGGVAHDFNNLLTAILGNADLLRRMAPASLHRQIDGILYAGRQGAALTARLLGLSRQQVVQPLPLHLEPVLREVGILLRRLLEENIELEIRAVRDLPAVRADRGQLEQVVMNLVLNARDALPSGGTVRVSADRWKAEDGTPGIELVVEDDGTGMDEGTRLRALEPFFTTRSQGTGLGLATVADVVRACGGDLDLASVPGEGTTVRVRLPATSVPSEVPEASDGRRPLDRDRCILVVDDAALVLRTACRALEQAGYRTAEASDGQRALEILERPDHGIDMVLTDVVMPGLGGRQLLESLQRSQPDLPVLLMSGYTDDHILREGIEASAIPLVRKPFTAGELVAAVDRILGET